MVWFHQYVFLYRNLELIPGIPTNIYCRAVVHATTELSLVKHTILSMVTNIFGLYLVTIGYIAITLTLKVKKVSKNIKVSNINYKLI